MKDEGGKKKCVNWLSIIICHYIAMTSQSEFVYYKQVVEEKNQKYIIFFSISFEYIKYILYLCIAIENKADNSAGGQRW